MSVGAAQCACRQVQLNGCFAHATKLGKTCFSHPPKPFDPVTMTMTPGKFIVAMIDIDQSIIAGKPIRIDDALKLCLASNDRIQRG